MSMDADGDWYQEEARAAARTARQPARTPPALLAGLTSNRAELHVALDQIARLVNVMRAADPEYCAAHEWEPCDDQEWDEVLSEAEDYIEEMRAKVYAT